jgi:hypothetical protein
MVFVCGFAAIEGAAGKTVNEICLFYDGDNHIDEAV